MEKVYGKSAASLDDMSSLVCGIDLLMYCTESDSVESPVKISSYPFKLLGK